MQLSEGQLPEAFEGEERSVAGVGDVLQLVSGRQLLGVVRERQDAFLPGPITPTSPCQCPCYPYCSDALPHTQCHALQIAAVQRVWPYMPVPTIYCITRTLSV